MKILKFVPFIWVLFNVFLLFQSGFLSNIEYKGVYLDVVFEHLEKFYPFHTQNLGHYDFSEFLFYCIVPVYLCLLIIKLIRSKRPKSKPQLNQS